MSIKSIEVKHAIGKIKMRLKEGLLIILTSILWVRCDFVPENQIEEIYVTAIDWDIHLRYRLDSKEIFNWKEEKITGVICDQSILREIDHQIAELNPLEGFDGVNVRMVCVMVDKNGVHDTLKIGSPQIFFFRGKFYDKNPELVRLIEDNMNCN